MGASDMEMVQLFSLEDYSSMPANKWGIRQPNYNQLRPSALELGCLDMILVPGLAFTREGARLGHGRGYYDKFLAKYTQVNSARPYTVGLALSQQILISLPVNPHDFTLDAIIYQA